MEISQNSKEKKQFPIKNFFIMGPDIEESYKASGIDLKSLPNCNIYICKNESELSKTITEINKEIKQIKDEKNTIVNLIINGHGNKNGRVNIGKLISPQILFDKIKYQGPFIVNVFACHIGKNIRESNDVMMNQAKFNLRENQLMIFHAGNKKTLITNGSINISEIIKHQFFYPSIFNSEGEIQLPLPETLKIISKEIKTFSPFSIFKKAIKEEKVLDKKDIFLDIIEEQRKILRFYQQCINHEDVRKEISKDLEALDKVEYNSVTHNKKIDEHLGELFILAVNREKYNYAKYLIEELKVDVSTTLKDGTTPLYIACYENNPRVVKFLIKEIEKIEEEKENYINKTNDEGLTPLYISCYNNNLEIVKFLVENGAEINQAYNGITPLYTYCQRGDFEIVKLLIENNADVNYCFLAQNPNNKDEKIPVSPLMQTIWKWGCCDKSKDQEKYDKIIDLLINSTNSKEFNKEEFLENIHRYFKVFNVDQHKYDGKIKEIMNKIKGKNIDDKIPDSEKIVETIKKSDPNPIVNTTSISTLEDKKNLAALSN